MSKIYAPAEHRPNSEFSAIDSKKKHIAAEHYFWFEAPYGMWICEDGREILFNRNYQAIWQRYPDQYGVPAYREEWVENIKQDVFFYTEKTSPRKIPETKVKLLKILDHFQRGLDVAIDLIR